MLDIICDRKNLMVFPYENILMYMAIQNDIMIAIVDHHVLIHSKHKQLNKVQLHLNFSIHLNLILVAMMLNQEVLKKGKKLKFLKNIRM